MSIEPLYEEIVAGHLKALGSKQIVVEAKLRPVDDQKIAKILAVQAESSVPSSEALEGEVRFSGEVNFRVLFVDDKGGLCSMEYVASFNDKFQNECINPTANISITSDVMDTETASVTPSEIKVNCVVNLSFCVALTEKTAYLKEGAEKTYTQSEKFTYDTFSAAGKEQFLVEEEFDCKEDISSVLLCEPAIVQKDCNAGLDCVVFSGTALVNVVFLTSDGRIKNQVFSTDYTAEINAPGARVADRVWGESKLGKFEAVLESELGSDKKILKCSFVVMAEAVSVCEAEAEPVVDAYSVTNEIRITGESFKLNKFLGCFRFEEKVQGNAAISDDLPSVDNILAVCASRINIANAYAKAGKVTFEGVISTGIIYFNNETESKSSVSVELPYSVTVNCAAATDTATVDAKACLCEVNARLRHQREIEISAEAVFLAKLNDEQVGFIIKEIAVGAEKPQPDTAMTVYIVKKGEGLWELAKALSTTPETIQQQNPHLKTPLEGGEKVLIYRQLS